MTNPDPEHFFTHQEDPDLRADQLLYRLDQIHSTTLAHLNLTRAILLALLILIAIQALTLAALIATKL